MRNLNHDYRQNKLLDLTHETTETLRLALENLQVIADGMEANGEFERNLPMKEGLLASGMKLREVEALLLLVIKNQPAKILAEQWGVGTGRVSQIKGKALRKLCHPARASIVKKFKLKRYLPPDKLPHYVAEEVFKEFVRLVPKAADDGTTVWCEEV